MDGASDGKSPTPGDAAAAAAAAAAATASSNASTEEFISSSDFWKTESSASLTSAASATTDQNQPPLPVENVDATNDNGVDPESESPHPPEFLFKLELENAMRKKDDVGYEGIGNVAAQDEKPKKSNDGDATATDATNVVEQPQPVPELVESEGDPSVTKQDEREGEKSIELAGNDAAASEDTSGIDDKGNIDESESNEGAEAEDEVKPEDEAAEAPAEAVAETEIAPPTNQLEDSLPKKDDVALDDDTEAKEENNGGGEESVENEDKPAGVEETAEVADPQPAAESIDEKDDGAPRLNGEFLFDDSKINIPAFDDGSVESRQKKQGWTNQKWIAASEKVLVFTMPVFRARPGRYFWSNDVYKKRILAIYKNPDVILILRLPADKEEVCRLLPVQGDLELSQKELHGFLVVESAADPKTCKVHLSQLTHPTSVASQAHHGSSKKDVPRRRSCFDIVTPTEEATLSAAFLPDDNFHDLEYTSETSLNETLRCEDAIVSALVDAHSIDMSIHGDTTWKHQVVLGTLHSNVISGNDKSLKASLENALKLGRMSQIGDESKTNAGILDSSIMDARDESGKAALHYACSRRRNSTVQLLVTAGADCTLPQFVDELTPCHICAKNLDEKSLSIVLSSSYPVRPNPNAVDCHGRTPSYSAAVEGTAGTGNNNAMALDLCLSALEAWGGQLMVDLPGNRRELLHPVHCVSAQWKPAELSVLLSHCNYHYPLTKNLESSDQVGISVSAKFDYPIHAALISLRSKIISVSTKKVGNEFSSEFMPLEPPLVKTLQTLLEHGFEPNERFEGMVGSGEPIKAFASYWGYTPLQILALAAAEARIIESKLQESGDDDAMVKRMLKNIIRVIQASAELLLKNGARINMQQPPQTRLDRPIPNHCYSFNEAVEDKQTSSMLISYREKLKLDNNKEFLLLIGGASRVGTFQNAFATIGKTVTVTGAVIGSSSLDSDAPGGSNSNSCAICWSEFGIISNRKHLCRVSRRYVCNDCSTKRLVDNGSEQRVSDGQFLLWSAQARKKDTKVKAGREEQMRKQRQSVTQARKSLGLKPKSGSGSSSDTNEKQAKLSTKDKITSAISGIGQARNAVLERGNKLESLADKTDALNQASLDFANMAKELNQSQNSWW